MRKPSQKSATAEAQRLIGQVLGEKYRIEGVIGRGGMGTVYRGLDLDLKRNVAVKVLHAAFSRNDIITRRFEREARSAAGLSHPNIVQVYDSGETKEGQRYLVMELLEGQELKALLGKPMRPRLALERAYQILSGLTHAHKEGIIHRDLKPENVFVTTDHLGQETLKLVDFGVAKVVDPGTDKDATQENNQPSREDTVALTQAGLIFGTPTYMSPEQATGTPVDARSDLYSFGVILFEMLAGRPPLYHKDPIRLIRMQVSVAPPPLSEDFSEDLRYFLHTLLAKERSERCDQSQDVLDELKILVQETPESMPPGPALTVELRDEWIKNTQEGREVLSHKDTHPGSSTGSWGKAPRPSLRRRLRLAYVLKRRWCQHHPVRAAGIAAASIGIAAGLFFGVDGLLNGKKNESRSNFTSSDGMSGPAPSTEELAAIDRALLAKDIPAAREHMAPLLKLYPDSGQLLWRQGKVRMAYLNSKRRKPDSQILATYSGAIAADSRLLDDPEFYREIYDLLTHPSIPLKDAVSAAVDYMGKHGHPYLLKVINRPIKGGRLDKSDLPFTQRHRIIDTLKTQADSASRIDQNIQLHRDLLQAQYQHDPCAVFLQTITQIGELEKKDYFLNPLHETHPPRPNPKNPDPDQAGRCSQATELLNAEREKLENSYGDGASQRTQTGAGQPKKVTAPRPRPSKTRDKKSGTSRTKGQRNSSKSKSKAKSKSKSKGRRRRPKRPR